MSGRDAAPCEGADQTEDARTVQIRFKRVGGEEHMVATSVDKTMGEVKRQLSEISKTDYERLSLIYDGRVLSDIETVGEVEFEAGGYMVMFEGAQKSPAQQQPQQQPQTPQLPQSQHGEDSWWHHIHHGPVGSHLSARVSISPSLIESAPTGFAFGGDSIERLASEFSPEVARAIETLLPLISPDVIGDAPQRVGGMPDAQVPGQEMLSSSSLADQNGGVSLHEIFTDEDKRAADEIMPFLSPETSEFEVLQIYVACGRDKSRTVSAMMM